MKSAATGSVVRDILSAFIQIVAQEIVTLAIAFVVGTVGGAIFCWYFDFPLVYALGGGWIMVIIFVAMMPGSIFLADRVCAEARKATQRWLVAASLTPSSGPVEVAGFRGEDIGAPDVGADPRPRFRFNPEAR